MNLEESIQAIRSLKSLDPGRKNFLIRRLIDAPTTGVWGMVVAEARAEDLKNSIDADAYITEELRIRRRAEKEQENTPRKPQEPLSAPIPLPVTPEGPRPVTITWTTPRNPEGKQVLKGNDVTINRKKICPPSHKHEKTATCVTGHACRCDPCRVAQSARRGKYRKR